MKPIIIQDKQNKNFKLTVAADEVRIKLAADTTEEERAEIIAFFTYVASLPEIQNCDKTLRGCIKSVNDKSAKPIDRDMLQLTIGSKYAPNNFKFYRSNFVKPYGI